MHEIPDCIEPIYERDNFIIFKEDDCLIIWNRDGLLKRTSLLVKNKDLEPAKEIINDVINKKLPDIGDNIRAYELSRLTLDQQYIDELDGWHY